MASAKRIIMYSGDNFHNDWKTEDGIVANATYSPTVGASYNLDFIVTTPCRVEEPRESWGKYRRWVCSIQLPIDYLHAAPKPRDKINWGFTLTPDSPTITFQITKITDTSYLQSPYFCTCDYLDFVGTLDDEVSYITSTSSTTATGARTVSDSYSSPIAAAIEPIDAKIEDAFGALTSPSTYMIYLYDDPSGTLPTQFRAGDMFKDQNGFYYEITEVMDRERLDLLPSFKTVRKLNG